MNLNEKYELYNILNENGYIPSEENAFILYEKLITKESSKDEKKNAKNKLHGKKSLFGYTLLKSKTTHPEDDYVQDYAKTIDAANAENYNDRQLLHKTKLGKSISSIPYKIVNKLNKKSLNKNLSNNHEKQEEDDIPAEAYSNLYNSHKNKDKLMHNAIAKKNALDIYPELKNNPQTSDPIKKWDQEGEDRASQFYKNTHFQSDTPNQLNDTDMKNKNHKERKKMVKEKDDERTDKLDSALMDYDSYQLNTDLDKIKIGAQIIENHKNHKAKPRLSVSDFRQLSPVDAFEKGRKEEIDNIVNQTKDQLKKSSDYDELKKDINASNKNESYENIRYELYNILNENGYIPSEENLSILEENILTDRVVILEDFNNIILDESDSLETILSEILDMNNFNNNKENIDFLIECLDNSDVLLSEGLLKKIKKWYNKKNSKKNIDDYYQDEDYQKLTNKEKLKFNHQQLLNHLSQTTTPNFSKYDLEDNKK